MTVFTHVVEHRANQALVQTAAPINPGPGQQVAGNLLANQLVETDIAVESPDQVVTVLPRPLGRIVPLVPVRVGVADHVHPVTGHPFAEVRRFQQSVNHFSQGPFSILSKPLGKAANQFGCRRQSGQDKGQPSQQGQSVGIRRGRQMTSTESCQHKPVDGPGRPVVAIHIRRRHPGHRLQAPPLASLGEHQFPGLFGRLVGGGGMITRIRSPLFDPFPKVGDDVLGEFFLRRHLQRPMLKSIDQQALVHSSGNHRRTGFATGTNRRTAVDPQPALDLGCRGRVARVALADQDRPNPALKEFLSLRISCRQSSRGGE